MIKCWQNIIGSSKEDRAGPLVLILDGVMMTVPLRLVQLIDKTNLEPVQDEEEFTVVSLDLYTPNIKLVSRTHS